MRFIEPLNMRETHGYIHVKYSGLRLSEILSQPAQPGEANIVKLTALCSADSLVRFPSGKVSYTTGNDMILLRRDV